MTNTNSTVQKLVRMAALAALSVVLVLVIHFPLIPAAPFLEFDPGDIPILISAFLYGPWWGLAVTVVVSLIQGITVSAASGWIGIVMHILATGSFCITAGLIYQNHRTIQRAIAGLVSGTLVMTAVMAGLNLLLTPIFMNAPLETVIAMLLPAIVPFNLLKAGMNSVVTFLIYKPISRLFAKNIPADEAAVEPEKEIESGE